MSNALSLARTDAPGLLSPASRAALPFVAPALLLMGLVILVPALYVLWLSFHRLDLRRRADLRRLGQLRQDPAATRTSGARWSTRSVIVLVVVHVELLLGLAMALAVRRRAAAGARS